MKYHYVIAQKTTGDILLGKVTGTDIWLHTSQNTNRVFANKFLIICDRLLFMDPVGYLLCVSERNTVPIRSHM